MRFGSLSVDSPPLSVASPGTRRRPWRRRCGVRTWIRRKIPCRSRCRRGRRPTCRHASTLRSAQNPGGATRNRTRTSQRRARSRDRPRADRATTTISAGPRRTKESCRDDTHSTGGGAITRRRPRAGRPVRAAHAPRPETAHRHHGGPARTSITALYRRSVVGALVRQMRAQLHHMVAHVPALLIEVAGDGFIEARVAQPVRRIGGGGREAAADLVFALRARLETREAVGDAVINTAVIAGLEVQAVKLLARAPITAIERVVAAQAQGGRHVIAAVACQHHHHLVGQARAEFFEQANTERHIATLLQKRAAIKTIERPPLRATDFSSV